MNDIHWARFNIKTVFPEYRDSHYKDEMVDRPSYFYNEKTYSDKTTSLYWDGPQVNLCATKMWLQWHRCWTISGREYTSSNDTDETTSWDYKWQSIAPGSTPSSAQTQSSPSMFFYVRIVFYDEHFYGKSWYFHFRPLDVHCYLCYQQPYSFIYLNAYNTYHITSGVYNPMLVLLLIKTAYIQLRQIHI